MPTALSSRRSSDRARGAAATLLAALLLPSQSLAEGSTELGSGQTLLSTTGLNVDVLASSETIEWTGTGSATVRDPGGAIVATLSSGQGYVAPASGTYAVELSDDQATAWDLGVDGATGGRLWSDLWFVDGGGLGMETATDASFYALLPGGSAATSEVVEIRLDGLAGFVWRLAANRRGVDGISNGASVESDGHTVTPEHPLYLAPPEIASHSHVAPNLTDADFLPGEHQFRFSSDAEGTVHLLCDLDDDSVFDPVGSGDRLLIRPARSLAGDRLFWDGTDNSGALAGPGTYDCRLVLRVGEIHVLVDDAETSYEGFRLFEVDGSLARSGLPMYWNDDAVDGLAILMPNGDQSATTSGANGVDSGAYGDSASPHGKNTSGNARAWGGFVSNSKGNGTFLDTFSWLDEDSSADLEVVFDPSTWPIFADGFESGDVTLWSSSTGSGS